MGGHKNEGKVTDGEQDQIGRSDQPNLRRYARTKKENGIFPSRIIDSFLPPLWNRNRMQGRQKSFVGGGSESFKTVRNGMLGT